MSGACVRLAERVYGERYERRVSLEAERYLGRKFGMQNFQAIAKFSRVWGEGVPFIVDLMRKCQ